MSELRISLRTAIAKALDRTDEMRGELFSDRINVIENAVLDVIVDGIMANDEPLTEGDMKAVEEFNQILARIKAKLETEPPIQKARGWPKPGDKMRYLDEGGYPRDREEASKHFTKGQTATVRDFHLGDWHSTIAFEGVPGWFNSVMFEHVDEGATPMTDTEAVQRVRDHVERHKDKERAMFSIAGLRAVLEENANLREILACALDECEQRDGVLKDSTDPHWSNDARRLLNGGQHG